MRVFKFLTAFLMMLSFSGLMGQEKINKFTEKADELYRNEFYFAAIAPYSEAYPKSDKEEKVEIVKRLCECFFKTKNYKKAVVWYKKGERLKIGEKEPDFILDYAETLKLTGDYKNALIKFNEYKEKVPNSSKGINGAKSCELAQKWKDEPTRHKVANVKLLNSKKNDVAPTYVGEGEGAERYREIIYSTYREDVTGGSEDDITGQPRPDLFYAKMDPKGKWSIPVGDPFNTTVNTKEGEGGPFVNKDRNKLYFTRCIKPKEGVQGCKIYESIKKGDEWGEVKEIFVAADSFSVGHPTLAIDEKTLYFASDMPGGQGGKDIWKMTYDEVQQEWVDPINMGVQINTEGDELYPFIHDNGSIYFSSNGHIGMGGYDLFMAEKVGSGWGPVTNLKYPMNSAADEYSLIMEDGIQRGYFASNRAGGVGSVDIYSFVLPKLEFAINGRVLELGTEQPIANAKVTLKGNNGDYEEVKSTEGGGYSFKLKPEVTYELTATSSIRNKKTAKLLYPLGDKTKVTTVGEKNSKKFEHDFHLEKFEDDIVIELPNILYETGSAVLLAESKISLNSLVKTLNDYPYLVIELRAHTDYRGGKAYNLGLSEDRAKSVMDYLLENGIRQERLQSKGFGEDAPRKVDEKVAANLPGFVKEYVQLDDVLTEKYIRALPKKVQAHLNQLNRRTEFAVISTDYISPEMMEKVEKLEQEDN